MCCDTYTIKKIIKTKNPNRNKIQNRINDENRSFYCYSAKKRENSLGILEAFSSDTGQSMKHRLTTEK